MAAHEAKHNCQLGKELGKGTYGAVYSSGEDSVVKITYTAGNMDYTELDILFRLDSHYIVKGKEIFEAEECGLGGGIGIKMERCVGEITDLYCSVNEKGQAIIRKDYPVLKNLVSTIMMGLKHLHQNGYCHLDLGPKNIMYSLSSDYIIIAKIIDLGAAVKLPFAANGMRSSITLPFLKTTVDVRPPEHFSDSSDQSRKIGWYTYSDKTDIWSLGMTILFVFYGDEAYRLFRILDPNFYFENKQMYDLLNKYFKGPNVKLVLRACLRLAPEKDKDLLVDLLSHMLDWDVKSRYNIEQVYAHEYFADINIPNQECRVIETNIQSKDFSSLEIKCLHHMFTLLKQYSSYCTRDDADFIAADAFQAVDLYIRMICLIPKTDQMLLEGLMYLAYKFSTGLRIAIEGSEFYHRGAPAKIHGNAAVAYGNAIEVQTLKSLSGRIYRKNIFESCSTLNEMAYVYAINFIKGNNLNEFIGVDFDILVERLKDVVKIPKDVRVNGLETIKMLIDRTDQVLKILI
jgi:serine/threonine protein kinase